MNQQVWPEAISLAALAALSMVICGGLRWRLGALAAVVWCSLIGVILVRHRCDLPVAVVMSAGQLSMILELLRQRNKKGRS